MNTSKPRTRAQKRRRRESTNHKALCKLCLLSIRMQKQYTTPSSSNITSDDKLAASVVAGWRMASDDSACAAPSADIAASTTTGTSVSSTCVQQPTMISTGLKRSLHDGTHAVQEGEVKLAKNCHTPLVPTSIVNPTFPPAYFQSELKSENKSFSSQKCPENTATTDEQDENSPRELLPAPYFYYRDHSTDEDDDPLTPLTPLARVPNFPAKMHAILSRSDLADVVTWLPHGRAWRILKPREFEVRVIPSYFEHNKFSSFIRQANGWGFRRITKGPDRNSYYHELFLRGIPHLSKRMKRPGPSKKPSVDPDHEPDLQKISEEHPVPEKGSNPDDILLPSTLIGGPKGRMNVPSGQMDLPPSQSGIPMGYVFPEVSTETPSNHVLSHQNQTHFSSSTRNHTNTNIPSSILHPTPRISHQQCLETQVPQSSNHTNPSQMFQHSSTMIPSSNSKGMSMIPSYPLTPSSNPFSSSHQMSAVHQVLSSLATQDYFLNEGDKQRAAAAVAAIGNDPTSQFAAGFAAAAALTNTNFQFAFSQALAMSSQAANSVYLPNSMNPPTNTTAKKENEEGGVTARKECQN